MRVMHDPSWTRRGTTLLWGAGALSRVARPDQVVSLRSLLLLGKSWPEDLPGGGDGLVVAGLEACLDVLAAEDVETWLDREFRVVLLGFQDRYQGEAALILWMPSGRKRVHMSPADESYHWRGSPAGRGEIALGRLLFSGAEGDLVRLLDPSDPKQDTDGDAWVGLHIARIS